MSNEQSIRDELAKVAYRAWREAQRGEPIPEIELEALSSRLEEKWMQGVADAILTSPVIRRIQAEAVREAADSIERRRNEPGLVRLDVQYAGYYTGIRSGMESSVKALRSEADRIERGETA